MRLNNFKEVSYRCFGVVLGALSALPAHAASSGAETDPSAVTSQAKALADKQADWEQPFVMALYRDGEWGAVLNLDRLGLAAMEKQDYALARKSFDEAIVRVEAIYANDANATKARSAFNEEKVKDFKGEPYERSMMYYYRGLLYVQEGDYQNARAAFLAADRHDSLSSAESTTFTGSFGLMKYLAGWASQCDSDSTRAAQLIEESRAIDPKMQTLLEKPTNSIILIDYGIGPVKWGDGKYHEMLKFKASAGDEPTVSLNDASQSYTNPLLGGDVVLQATTRGGREIDGIMNGKAKFKGNADATGDVAMLVGLQTAQAGINSNNTGLANAGMFGMFVGLIAKGVAAATTPAADLRGWDTLPGKIMVYQEEGLASKPLTLMVSDSPRQFLIQVTSGKCSMAWGRTDSALSTSMGGHAQFADQKPLEANRGDRNMAFREMLANELVTTK